MCGILLIYGEGHQTLLQKLLAKLHHRGPDDSKIYRGSNLSIGFTRLAINAIDNGAQPFEYGEWVSVTNGEIYNHHLLKTSHQQGDLGDCDTHIIAPSYDRVGADILQELDGFYSGILYHKPTGQIVTLRDYIGKKPLFLVTTPTHHIITSELKIIDNIRTFQIIPKGLCKVDMAKGEVLQIAHHQMPTVLDKTLATLLTQAVMKRIPPENIPFGCFISGGVDSSIIAKLLTDATHRTKFYLLANQDSADDAYAKILLKHLNISDAVIVDLPTKDELPALIDRLVYITESYNPSIISNGLCYYLLARAAKQDGCKVALCGEGADEIFCGYHPHLEEQHYLDIKQKLLNDMHVTELRRVDLAAMHHHIEVRLPYLDKAVFAYAENLAYDDFYRNGHNKYILRKSFENLLPDDIIWRKKTSADVGSGIRKMVVTYLINKYGDEKSALRDIWLSHFQHHQLADDAYFHSYPTFDEAIKNRRAGHQNAS